MRLLTVRVNFWQSLRGPWLGKVGFDNCSWKIQIEYLVGEQYFERNERRHEMSPIEKSPSVEVVCGPHFFKLWLFVREPPMTSKGA